MPRVNPHFKVHTSIQSHRKTVELYGDNDLFAAYVRIGLRFIDRFGDRTNDEIKIRAVDIPVLTGTKTIEDGRKMLRKLAKNSPLVITSRSRTVVIKLPNFAIKQGFHDRKTYRKPPLIVDSASASASATKKEEERAVSPNSKTTCPEMLSVAEHVRVRLWFAYCFPAETGDAAEVMIEQALTYYQGVGTRFLKWGKVVQNNIRSRRTSQQKREDPSYKARSLKQSKDLHSRTKGSDAGLRAVAELIEDFKVNRPDEPIALTIEELVDIAASVKRAE